MNLRVFLGCCGVALILAGCDTPGVRARCHPGAFGKLSPADRQLVLAGKVRPGMDKTAVYLAWGEPDAKGQAGDGKDPAETWLYRRQLTLQPAMGSFDRWLPGNSVFGGRGVPLTLRGGFGFGGVGNEGMTLQQPHLLLTDDTVKRADFEGGKLTHFDLFPVGLR